jgi:uncharacterized protein (TIGR03435 family)
VRANTKGPTSYSYTWLPGGRFRAVNLSLRMLLNVAYDLRSDNQLMGAPGWTASERFDIEAIPAVQVDRPQQRLMQVFLRIRKALLATNRRVRESVECPDGRMTVESEVQCSTGSIH